MQIYKLFTSRRTFMTHTSTDSILFYSIYTFIALAFGDEIQGAVKQSRQSKQSPENKQ